MQVNRRAAIITLYGLYNYGNRLQNLAVQRSLTKRGFDVETLIVKNRYPGATFRDLVLKIGHSLGLRRHVSKKYRSFAAFDSKVAKRRVWSSGHLRRLGSRYGVVVVGSDQIWNSYRIRREGAEFGSFAPNAKKVALSPSFGVTSVDGERFSEFVEGLGAFASLSVREFSGQALVRKLTGRDVPVLIDPTMSMSSDEWRAHSDERLVPSVPFALVYLLGQPSDEKRAEIQEFVRGAGLEPVVIMHRSSKKYFDAGPQDFLALIDKADRVITDSFHAVVFSLLFDTQSYLVERDDRMMGTRFDTLVQHFGLTLRQRDPSDPATMIEVNREHFELRLSELRGDYDTYLDEALGGSR